MLRREKWFRSEFQYKFKNRKRVDGGYFNFLQKSYIVKPGRHVSNGGRFPYHSLLTDSEVS